MVEKNTVFPMQFSGLQLMNQAISYANLLYIFI